MKNWIAVIVFVFSSVQALALQQYESDDFNIVTQKISELGQRYGVENVLVVYDLDNTLLAMKTDIGSDQWFDWQSALLKTPQDPNLVATDFDSLLRLQGFLYGLGRMRLTQNELPALYAGITRQGFHQILLTSRGPEFRDATEREILGNRLPVWNPAIAQSLTFDVPYDLNDLGKSCLTEDDKVNFKLGPPRATSVGKNIILSSGQHKGMILKVWLCRMKRTYKAIVFSDDKISNINNMITAFGASKDVELVTFRYSREDQRVHEFFHGDKKQAVNEWLRLAPVLSEVFGVYP